MNFFGKMGNGAEIEKITCPTKAKMRAKRILANDRFLSYTAYI
jgi:hypothetical protein